MSASKNTPTCQGIVTRVGEKTCYVETKRHIKHDFIGKFVKRKQKFVAHDPQQLAQVGQTVLLRSCARRSKSKAWELESVLSEA